MRSFLRLAFCFLFLLTSWLGGILFLALARPSAGPPSARTVHLITAADRSSTYHPLPGDLLVFRLPYDPELYYGWEYLSVIPELIPVGESIGIEECPLQLRGETVTHRVILCRCIAPLSRSYTCALTCRSIDSMDHDKRFVIHLSP